MCEKEGKLPGYRMLINVLQVIRQHHLKIHTFVRLHQKKKKKYKKLNKIDITSFLRIFH